MGNHRGTVQRLQLPLQDVPQGSWFSILYLLVRQAGGTQLA
jgi:hypothetical protein